MKAAEYLRAGELVYREITDSHPGPGEVKIAVAWCGICGTDLHIFQGHMDQRLSPPQSIGHEMSGWIAEIGADVTGWQVGDAVTVRPLENCGKCPTCQAGWTHICENLHFLGIETPGAFAEYWTVPASLLHRLPAGMAMEVAALVEPLAVACHDVRLADIQEKDFVVVFGGGPIGILIALAARKAGGKVTVVEIQPARRAFAQELGFSVLDPQNEDAVAAVRDATGGSGADIFFEVSASQAGAAAMTAMTRPRGKILVVGIFSHPVSVDLHKFFWKELQVRGARVYEKEDFDKAIALAAGGELPLSRLITKTWPLAEIQEAFRYLQNGNDAMKVLIRCQEGGVK
ncbi:MAG: alcohol dehydrogenase catalytic domain-containing protein [Planctomycetia bacterium]|nr:alcohol dehydrogenase catalytic domain-containing protein [Planctomycetia bacterium]